MFELIYLLNIIYKSRQNIVSFCEDMVISWGWHTDIITFGQSQSLKLGIQRSKRLSWTAVDGLLAPSVINSVSYFCLYPVVCESPTLDARFQAEVSLPSSLSASPSQKIFSKPKSSISVSSSSESSCPLQNTVRNLWYAETGSKSCKWQLTWFQLVHFWPIRDRIDKTNENLPEFMQDYILTWNFQDQSTILLIFNHIFLNFSNTP